MAVAGVDRRELQGWDLKRDAKTSSFLDGLESVRLREDPMVVNDLSNLPGFSVLRTAPFNSTVFENDHAKLTVVLANRLPLEEQLGVDLIYYNKTFSCFVMVQYKAMEDGKGDNNEPIFRFPNDQLTKELGRMTSVLHELRKVPQDNDADGYRLTDNPFFLKICPRIVFDPDDISLVKGMYLPLDYWDRISKHSSVIGPKGGSGLTYANVRRYFDNTEFVTVVSGGWVGTSCGQSKLLEAAIRSTLESGRAVVFAVSEEKMKRSRKRS